MVVPYAFAKSQRLRKRADYLRVQRAGKAQHGRYFVLVSSQAGHGRVGITVSKKVGNAVIRNRVKRLVREFVRTAKPPDQRWQEGPWLPGSVDLVVIAKEAAATAPAATLWTELASFGPALSRRASA